MPAMIANKSDPVKRIYLDHAATTNIMPEAQKAMAEALVHWANPSSVHHEGRRARALMEGARRRILEALGADRCMNLVFTSGASEALSLGLGRTQMNRVAVGATEHEAVLRVVPDATRLAVDRLGRIEIEALQHWLAAEQGPGLVAVQQANNETGVVQDTDHLASLVREAESYFLCDAAQTAGRVALPDADLISVSAHKFGGPPGIGALLLRDEGLIHALGGQERGLRAGTENLPAIMGFAAALEARADWYAQCGPLQQRLEEGIRAAGGEVIGQNAKRVPWISAIHMPGTPAATQLMHFDLAGISVSAGAACSSGSMKTSHVLKAMGYEDRVASEVIRVSFAPHSQSADVEAFIHAWQALAAKQGVSRGEENASSLSPSAANAPAASTPAVGQVASMAAVSSTAPSPEPTSPPSPSPASSPSELKR